MGQLFNILFGNSKNNNNDQAQFMDRATKRQIFKRKHKGLLIDGKSMRTRIQDNTKHVLVLGGSGMGKSSTMILPSILDSRKDKSMVITDTGELYKKSRHYLAKMGFEVKVIDLIKPENSEQFNPLSFVKNGTDAVNIARTLVRIYFPGNGQNPYWELQAISVIALIIKRLVLTDQKILPKTLASVYLLVNKIALQADLTDPEDVANKIPLDDFFVLAATEQEQDQYMQLVKLEDSVLGSILSTAKSALSEMENPEIQHLTAETSIDITNLRNKEKPLALFIIQQEDQLEQYAFYTTMIYKAIFGYLMEADSHSDALPVYCFLDEFDSQNFGKEFKGYCATLRRKSVALVVVLQSLSQLYDKYGREGAKTILGNLATKIVFGGLTDLEATKWLENLLGTYTDTNEKGYEKTKSLMASYQIRRLKKEVLFLFESEDPILIKKKPYYKSWRLNRRTKAPKQ